MDSTVKRVFISRALAPESPFRKGLEGAGWEVVGESLLTFEPVPFEQLPPADWIFFSSAQGVRHFFGQLPPETALPHALAAMGPGTAKALQALGKPPRFTGDGDPARTAESFLRVAHGQRVLFPQAKNSRRSIQRRLEGHILALDLVVYDNRPRTDVQLPPCDVAVLTSPLNARAFLALALSTPPRAFVAIGGPTAEALHSAGAQPVFQAERPDEASLARTVLNLPFSGAP